LRNAAQPGAHFAQRNGLTGCQLELWADAKRDRPLEVTWVNPALEKSSASRVDHDKRRFS